MDKDNIYSAYISDISDIDKRISSIIEELSKKNVIKHLVKYKGVLDVVNNDLLKKITNSCGDLRLNPVYECLEYNIDGKWEEVIEIETGIKDMPVDITNYIPEPPYDVDAEGELDSMLEIRNFYITAVISEILKEDFKEEFNRSFSLIRRNNRLFDSNDPKSFTSLLGSFQKLNSSIITILVSACLIKISEKRETGDSIKIRGLSTEEYSDIKRTSDSIKRINRSWNSATGRLSQENISNMTKIEILQALSEKDALIFDVIENSKYPMLYRINKINPENLGPITKNRIEVIIEQNAQEYKKNLASKDYSKLISRVRKKAARLACIDLIAVEVSKYRKDPVNYKFTLKR